MSEEALNKARDAMKVAINAQDKAHQAKEASHENKVRLDGFETISDLRWKNVEKINDRIEGFMKWIAITGAGIIGFLVKLTFFPGV